jgi:hypothetical protein
LRKSLPLVAALLSTAVVAGCVEGGDPSQEVEQEHFALCSATKLATTNAVSSAAPKQAAKNAIDGNTGTRWESAYSDPQWIYVDLGAVKTVTEVRIDWQHAAAKDYRIDVSNDAVNWSAPVVTRTGGVAVDHRIDDLTGFSVSARYVRVFGTARATIYGYSIWELTVYDGSSCGGTGTGGSGGGGAGGSAGSGGTSGSGGAGTGGSCTSANLLTPSSPVVASPSPKQAAKNAIDGNTGTRWESAYTDPQFIYVDLGAVKTITRVRIDWQHAAAKDYHVDVSNDAVNWSAPVVTKTGGIAVDHRIDDLTGLSASGRYVRIYGTARATVYGYSIWELAVYGFDPSCANNLLTAGWGANGQTNYTPATGFSFPSGKNAISFDYTNQSYSWTDTPPLVEFTQSITVPQAGSQWLLTLTISGMNDQTNFPPRFLASIDGVQQPSSYSPSTVQLLFNPGNRFVIAGSLTTGTQLTATFTTPFTAGQVINLAIDNAPMMATTQGGLSGVGQQKFDVTDASFVRLQ